jgi:hypothetical protein
MRVKVRVVGFKATRRTIAAMRSAMKRGEVTEIVSREVRPIAERASHYAPKVSGRLANSMAVSTQAVDPLRIDPVEVYVGPTEDVDYALPVEEGTPDGVVGPGQDYAGTAPHPYLRPAFDEEADPALRAIGTALVDRVLGARA